MSDLCPKCGMPKESSKSGRLSQFVMLCTCNLNLPEEDKQSVPIHICRNCKRMIREGRKGSITQFIFRSDICDCETPDPGESVIPESTSAFTFSEEEIEEEELDLESDSFPIDRYKPIKLLGSGASGDVYLARDRILNKKVAVKILKVLTDDQLVQFQEEAKATSSLNHPNIVTVYDFGVMVSSTPYMVLEYFESNTLYELLEECETLSWSKTKEILLSVLEALSYSHEIGVFHRDLKPENILLQESNQALKVKLIDFGVAKVNELTGKTTQYQDKTLAGTPSYMSPDPVLGRQYCPASEIYSLGCLTFECLTGSPPFSAETPLELLSMHVHNQVPDLANYENLEIPNQAIEFVNRCLEKDSTKRFESAKTAILFLEELVKNNETIEEPKQEEVSNKKKLRLLPIIGVFLALLLVSTFTISTLMAPSKNKESKKLSKKKSTEYLLEEANIKFEKKGDIKWHYLRGEISDKQINVLKKVKADHISMIEKSISQNQLEELIKLPLVELDARNSNVDDNLLKVIGQSKTLSILLLDGCRNISAAGLAEIQNLEKLEMLALTNTELTIAGLKQVAKNGNIKLLHVASNKQIDDKAIPILMNMDKLVVIGMGATNISAKGLANLQKHPSIRGLGLAKLDLDDSELPVFKKDLCSLDLSENPITDKSLNKILSLPRLLFLRVNHCDGLSLKGLNILYSRLSLRSGKIFMSDRAGILRADVDTTEIDRTYLPPEFYYETNPKRATELYMKWSNML